MSNVIRVTHARDLIAFIPYQLGYTPSQSVAVIALRGPGGRVGLIARIDLANAADAAPRLVSHMVTDGATSIVVIAYTDDEAAAEAATSAVTMHAAALTLDTTATFLVTAATYRHLDANPDDAKPLADLDASITAATMVSLGARARASRDDLRITPAPDDARTQATTTRDNHLTMGLHKPVALHDWRKAIAGAARTPDSAGRLAAALTDVTVRDAVVVTILGGYDVAEGMVYGENIDTATVGQVLAKMIDPATGTAPNDDDTQPVREVLAHVAAHTDSPAALTLLALVAWWHGDGATANVHLEDALTIDPDYRLAHLLAQALSVGLAPGWVRRSR